MRKLDVSSITDVSEMPVKQGTLQFLQDSYAEILGAIVQALLSPSYNPATVYVLFGVSNSGSGLFYNITNGVVFYQGEIFLVDAATFTAVGSNVAVFQIITTQYTTNADPVTFTDSAVRNIHNIRKVQVVQGLTGSGIADFTQASYCDFVIPPQLNLIADPAAGNQASVGGVYPNLSILVPGTGNLNPVLAAGSFHIGDVPGGGTPGQTYTIPIPGAPISTAAYYVLGTIVSQGTPQSDTQAQWSLIDSSRTTSQFQVHFAEFAGATQAIEFEFIIFKK